MTNSGYSISTLHVILGSSLALKDPARKIDELLIDSRKLNIPENTLFFALVGDRHDGHAFVLDLYNRGVRNFVVSNLPRGLEKMVKANFLKVSDTLVALQTLAAHHRSHFDIPVVGITGSNGKTIVKEWLNQLLSEDNTIIRSPKSYNSQVGVPLSVWLLQPTHDLAFFEAGISMRGEMKKLHAIVRPTVGVFTNIGDAHSENFDNVSSKIDEKLKLFHGAEVLFYGRTNHLLEERIEADVRLNKTKKVSWTAGDDSADLKVWGTDAVEGGTRIKARYKGEPIEIEIPFTDTASIENATLCWLVLLHNDVANKVVVERMKRLAPIGLRLEVKQGVNGSTIINDSYNSDIGSLQIALDLLKQQRQHKSRTLILSDIQQTGHKPDKLYQQVATLVNNQPLNRLLAIGPEIGRYKTLFKIKDKRFFKDTKSFFAQFSSAQFQQEAVLIKGARVFKFEEIGEMLQQQSHETVLEISMNAIVHNLNYFKAKLRPNTMVMAMVKAFSYGSGSHEIANVLQFHRVDYLGVAYADEGVELRKAGVSLPIMVMSPEEQSFNDLFLYNLEPEVYSMSMLQRLTNALKKTHLCDRFPFPIHIKLDTGMHRLGFGEDDLEEMIAFVAKEHFLKVQSVFSHLAASDEAEHDDFTQEQIKKFDKMSRTLTRELDYPVLRHLSNSAGIERFPEAQFDMVRLGIGLYGVGANRYEDDKLETVGTLKTSIVQIKSVKKGETIGYSRVGVAQKDMKIATVSIGYADGFSRQLSKGAGKMLVRGKKVPIIGNVCMDMCMLDISGIQAREGDEVIVFGKERSIRFLSQQLGTIPYEILTGISRRVKRVYFQE